MKIAVFGAGSIGVYVGLSLQLAGAQVQLIGRQNMATQLATSGAHLSDLHGWHGKLATSQITYTQDAAALADADLILVCVKSAATTSAAQAIAQYAKNDALIISLQNGVGNVELLRTHAGQRTVLAGMVPFNVVQDQHGGFHRGTEGQLCVQAHPALARWQSLFANAHLPLHTSDDFTAVQWGKLLLNLNNPINALSKLPLRQQLMQRPYRLVLASLIAEALRVLRVAGIAPAQIARVKPQYLPLLLRLPDFLFERIAGSMLRIDATARSSMWEDLQAKRLTEIDFLNGAIVALAKQHGTSAPANACVQELVHRAEQGNWSTWQAEVLWQTVQKSRLHQT